jgi:hypothetical protein
MEEFELPLGIMGKAIEAVGKGVTKRHINEYLDELKRLVEA